MSSTMPSTSSSSHHRVKRESSARAPDLTHMVYDHPPAGRPAAKFRMERYDSGYSSPGTPDMGPGESSGSPPKPTRYKIVDEPDLVDSQPPPPPSSSRSGGRTAKPIRSNSYIYPAEKSAPVPPPPSSSSSKPLYNEIPKYVREISPDSAHAPHVVYSKRDGPRQYHEDYRHHPAMGSRRQSTYA
ncbi:uncharacterized protein BDW47DRAFT_99020 [Aspergillus candidus]|uniref:Uncharacterized protein n=1 Tax=Aspergillus candidus TaxID=41067 RepID=A0A2I2FN42_ASPCN|nr:hypothetical protein BDW47DRAFT_99020 [Aspergillus candidus]PLB42039.1 hypothetical protein BDW47DRAFT_99020 [Aspergillus candidus]